MPGSPTAAVLLGGLLIWGLQPGPLLFVEQKDFVWGLIASMYLGNLAGLLVVLTCVPLFAAILLPIVVWRGSLPQLRANPRALIMVGVPFTALPFMLTGIFIGDPGWRAPWSERRDGSACLSIDMAGCTDHSICTDRACWR